MQLRLKTLVKGAAGLIVPGFVMLLVMTGCNSDVPDPDPVGYLSVYHVSPDADDIDMYVDGEKLNYVFEYGEFLNYSDIVVGTYQFQFTESGSSSTQLLSEIATFEENKFYSLFLTGESALMDGLITEDNPLTPSAGNAMVRFFHLSPDTGPVNFQLAEEEEPLHSDRAYRASMDFEEMTIGEYDFEVMDANADTLLVENLGVNLVEGRFYTIILQGYSQDPPEGNTNVLELNVLDHNEEQ